jgi:competence protein ComEC
MAPAFILVALLATNRIVPTTRPGLGALTRWLLIVSVALAAFGLTGWRAAHYAAYALQPALEGRDLQIDATIAAMPQRNAQGLRLRVAVDSATLDGQPVAVPPLLDLGWWNPAVRADRPAGTATAQAAMKATAPSTNAALPDVRAGDRWRFTARLKAPHGSRNPFGFDYELWAWEQGVQATGSIRNGKKNTPPLLLAATWRHPVERARQAVRDAILAQLAPEGEDAKTDSGAPKLDGPSDEGLHASETAPSAERGRQRAAGVVAALVTGDQRAIDRSDWDIFRATGTAHLVSISGLHISMFAWLAALAIGILWRRSARLCLRWPAPHAALTGGILCAMAYALFSGGGLPAQRTVIMLLVVGTLRISAKRWPWPLVWLLACAAVVLVDPWALLQAGFWLSFIAVGVLFASGLGAIDEIADSGGRKSATGSFRRKIRALFREQAVVTLALTPLTLLLFRQASLVSFVANLLAIPWMTLVVTPLALLGVLIHPMWELAAWAVQALAGVLQWLAAVPHAVVVLPAAPVWAAAVAVAGGVLLCMRLPWSLRLLGIAPLLPVLLWQQPRPVAGQFELLAADIGQGEAVLIRTAHHALLYDAGPRLSADDDAGHRVLVPFLHALGEKLDTVVVSHRDSDHAGGAAAVLAAQPQATLRSSIEASHPLQRVRQVERCIAGQSWEWDGVRFSILHPQAADYTPTARSNALSCVLRVESANHTAALLTGDIEAEQEAALVEAKAPLAADVLVAPHHGSRHSSTAGFLRAVAPRLVIVQAGYRNRYGHPAAESLQRYADQNSTVVASPACGAMRWQSGTPDAFACERTLHRHYWQHTLPAPGPTDTSVAAAQEGSRP